MYEQNDNVQRSMFGNKKIRHATKIMPWTSFCRNSIENYSHYHRSFTSPSPSPLLTRNTISLVWMQCKKNEENYISCQNVFDDKNKTKIKKTKPKSIFKKLNKKTQLLYHYLLDHIFCRLPSLHWELWETKEY